MAKGTVTVMEKHRLVTKSLKNTTSSFTELDPDGRIKLWPYTGDHAKRPTSDAQLLSVNLYSRTLAITRQQEFSKGQMVNDYMYAYSPETQRARLRRKDRIPLARRC